MGAAVKDVKKSESLQWQTDCDNSIMRDEGCPLFHLYSKS